MDIVLGVSMTPTTVGIVLVEGENADGVTIEEDSLDVTVAPGAATSTAPDGVISAILGTREGAAAAGYRLVATGVAWTDPTDAAALDEALVAQGTDNVMLVSAFLAAAALAQAVGHAIDYDQIAMLFVEPGSAVLTVVDCADGSIADVCRRPLDNGDIITELVAMVARLDALDVRPEGLFVV
ncbi:MAG: DUF7159 family protein, partial [Mycobacterium sp.]